MPRRREAFLQRAARPAAWATVVVLVFFFLTKLFPSVFLGWVTPLSLSGGLIDCLLFGMLYGVVHTLMTSPRSIDDEED